MMTHIPWSQCTFRAHRPTEKEHAHGMESRSTPRTIGAWPRTLVPGYADGRLRAVTDRRTAPPRHPRCLAGGESAVRDRHQRPRGDRAEGWDTTRRGISGCRSPDHRVRGRGFDPG